MERPLTVLCVWQTKPTTVYTPKDYPAEYVKRLARDVAKNLHMPYLFVCLADERPPAACLPLRHKWPGWWAKMEIYRLNGPCLYFDLDTVIVGDITPLARSVMESDTDISLLRGFFENEAQTGIAGWNGNIIDIYKSFLSASLQGSWRPESTLSPSFLSEGGRFRGDADWLRRHLTDFDFTYSYIQDHTPGVTSYKWLRRKGGGMVGPLPDDVRVVCFHGNPRPHEVAHLEPWMKGWL